MAGPLIKMVGTWCGRPIDSCFDSGGDKDGLMWCRNIGRHAAGEFSMAVVQANSLLEDASQIESGTHGTFVGVYDGHGGPEAARYVADNLFLWVKKYLLHCCLSHEGFIVEDEGMSVDVLHKAFSATEDGFLSLVKKNWSNMPLLATVGSCCLTGFICGGMLYVANLGDSRAVLGRFSMHERDVMAVQLTPEHNACHESVRQDLRLLHPDDPKIVVLKNRAWRVKGIIQVSRSIGDAYLKKAEFNREPLIGKFRVSESFSKPILLADPSVVAHKICPQDQFVIFASDGLWEHITNKEAVDIVQNFPHIGIARRLIETALQMAARKREMRYSDLKKIERGIRRHFHDDITVVVLFLDHSLTSKCSYNGPSLSLRGAK